MRITVADLFGNVPARRKFVRSLRAEGGQIQAIVMQYALSQPGIRFTLSIDGRVTFRSPGTGELGDAFAAVFGPDILADMIPVQAEERGIGVSGLCSKPAVTRANRSGLSVFVNGRTMQNRSLLFALEEAYSGFLMQGRHPVAAIHLTVPADEVDANIHPAKSEVRFARDREVHGALFRAVANTLLEMRLSATGRDDPLASEAFDSLAGAVQPDLLPEADAHEAPAEPQELIPGSAGPPRLRPVQQHLHHRRRDRPACT